jgi:hypothetical protein
VLHSKSISLGRFRKGSAPWVLVDMNLPRLRSGPRPYGLCLLCLAARWLSRPP